MVLTSNTKRVCLLTGASGQLGRAFCAAYRSEYDIAAVYHRNRPWFPSQDATTVDPLDPRSDRDENAHPLYTLRADLLAPGEPRRVIQSTLARYGRIDLIVHAAVSSVWQPMLVSHELANSIRTQFAMAVEVPLRLATITAELFWKSQSGDNRALNRNIVNVSSTAALQVYQGSGQSIYAASKAAMNQLSAHMAIEFGALGVRVNAAAPNSFPGYVNVERVVAAIHALDHSEVTGQLVVIDGPRDRWQPLGGRAAAEAVGPLRPTGESQ
jgi:NAD(P)-dependent dehydrogenase (short-subunit alcohol dehydrogenase family)